MASLELGVIRDSWHHRKAFGDTSRQGLPKPLPLRCLAVLGGPRLFFQAPACSTGQLVWLQLQPGEGTSGFAPVCAPVQSLAGTGSVCPAGFRALL